jgi:ATP-dependent protease ClpP protease subunit
MKAEASAVARPNIRLLGAITNETVHDFMDQLRRAQESGGPIVLDLTTQGGDADAARRIALEIRLCRSWLGLQTKFIGKTAVMSAGVTIMAAFPVADRFLTADAMLLIHERRLSKPLELKGPIRANLQIVREVLAELETAQSLEREGFAELVQGSRISLAELQERARFNYYLNANEALSQGLVAAVI